MTTWYRVTGDMLTLNLYIQPSAKRSEIVGLHDSALKIKLAAPPVEGRANEALLKLVAELFDVPLRNVVLKQGELSRRKTVIVNSSTIHPDILLNPK